MKFQEDLQLREKVFRKMGFVCIIYHMGAAFNPGRMKWTNREKTIQFKELPPIETSWEVCAEYLVPFMFQRGIPWEAQLDGDRGDWMHKFIWHNYPKDHKIIEIQNDNIPRAACEAFLEVEL